MVSGPESHGAVPAMPAGARKRSNRGIWLGGCGCLAALALTFVVVIAGVGFTVWAGFNAATPCVPSDFPEYPGAVWGGTWQASYSRCLASRLTMDRPGPVIDFYASRLGDGNWRINVIDRTINRIDFAHTGASNITGIVWVMDEGPFRVVCTQFEKPGQSAQRSGPPILFSLAGRGRPTCWSAPNYPG